MVLAIAAKIGWKVVQLDVKASFLFADIEDEVFVEAVPGFGKTCKDGVQLAIELGRGICMAVSYTHLTLPTKA